MQRHLAEQGLRSAVVKKYNYQANKEMINQKWCTDLTYIHVLKEGWTYLASVMDLCSRKIIGYACETSMTVAPTVQAVKNACLNVKDMKEIILHSNLGSQYASQIFEDYLASGGILLSFSRKEKPYDNACIESFHFVLKKEEIYLYTNQDFKEVRRAIFEYIEFCYNRKWIHSVMDYLTLQQKDDAELKKWHSLSTFLSKVLIWIQTSTCSTDTHCTDLLISIHEALTNLDKNTRLDY